eukprot:jgi/Botrbrau1/5764/Bobra.0134s0032.1
MARASRMGREIQLLADNPPPGVAAYPVDGRCDRIIAQIQGPKGTVYENGIFRVAIDIPERYPFEPPAARFITPILHPNIDEGGRICLDILNMPPKGAWRPALNIPTVLASIGVLLSQPNPEDGLNATMTDEFLHNRSKFDQRARDLTLRHATQNV